MSTNDLRGSRARVDTWSSKAELPQDSGARIWRRHGLLALLIGGLLFVPLLGMADGDEPGSGTERSDVTLDALTVDDSRRTSIPLDVHPRVEKWLEAFQTTRRAEFEHLLVKRGRYEDLILGELRARGMPDELIYIPMIESEYSPFAVSHVSAVGLWQFMSPTAMQYGLRVDPYVDERRDPVRATSAAVEYLSYLHDRFGSWYLAAAAFNAGPGRLERVLRRHAADREWNDALFWEIVDYLPRETREYIPKMIAVSRLANGADAIRFASGEVEPYRYETVFVPGSTSLASVAKGLDTDIESLRVLNPHLLQDVTPPGETFGVRVPIGDGAEAMAHLSKRLPLRSADDD